VTRRAIRTALLLTGAWLAAGAALALTAQPSPRPPDQVAQAFVEGVYSGDLPAAWGHLCEPIRANHTYAEFAERMGDVREHAFWLADPDVTVSDVRRSRGPDGSAFTVTLAVSSQEWSGAGFDSELLVVEEDGGFRACFDPDQPAS
jgi:hypothetical protein